MDLSEGAKFVSNNFRFTFVVPEFVVLRAPGGMETLGNAYHSSGTERSTSGIFCVSHHSQHLHGTEICAIMSHRRVVLANFICGLVSCSPRVVWVLSKIGRARGNVLYKLLLIIPGEEGEGSSIREGGEVHHSWQISRSTSKFELALVDFTLDNAVLPTTYVETVQYLGGMRAFEKTRGELLDEGNSNRADFAEKYM